MIKLLVNMGADLTLKDASDSIPLKLARKKKRLHLGRVKSGILDPKAQPEILDNGYHGASSYSVGLKCA